MSILGAAGGSFALILGARFFETGRNGADSPQMIETRTWVILVVWITAVVATLLIQFITRRTRISLAVLTAALVTSCAVTQWPSGEITKGETARAGPIGMVPGAARSSEIVAEIRPCLGEVSLNHGMRIKIIEAIANDPRGIAFTISESRPDPGGDAWGLLFDRPVPSAGAEFYFLVNRDEGRAIRGSVKSAGESLTAGAITYRRKELIFPLDQAQFSRWAKTVMLVKVVADDGIPLSAAMEASLFEVKPSVDGGRKPGGPRL
jgi:hypothetical protein